MFENIMKLFKKGNKHETLNPSSRDTAKERLHLVLMQDRANVSADFLDLMRQEIIEVIKKYIDIDESAMDVRLTNQANEDGTQGAPALYANIPILNIKDETRSMKNVYAEDVKDKKAETEKAELIDKEQNKKETTEEQKNEENIEKKEYETVKLDNKEDIKDDLNNQTDNKKQEESKDKIEVEVKQDNAEARTEEEKIIEEEQKIEEAKKIVEENEIEKEKENSETIKEVQQQNLENN